MIIGFIHAIEEGAHHEAARGHGRKQAIVFERHLHAADDEHRPAGLEGKQAERPAHHRYRMHLELAHAQQADVANELGQVVDGIAPMSRQGFR